MFMIQLEFGFVLFVAIASLNKLLLFWLLTNISNWKSLTSKLEIFQEQKYNNVTTQQEKWPHVSIYILHSILQAHTERSTKAKNMFSKVRYGKCMMYPQILMYPLSVSTCTVCPLPHSICRKRIFAVTCTARKNVHPQINQLDPFSESKKGLH